MVQNKDALLPFSVALGAVVAAAYLLANPVAMTGLAALVMGITGVGIAMHTLPLAKLQEFNEMMSTVTEAAKAGVTVKGKIGLANAEITATGAGGGGATAGINNQQIKVEVIVKGSDKFANMLRSTIKAQVQDQLRVKGK